MCRKEDWVGSVLWWMMVIQRHPNNRSVVLTHMSNIIWINVIGRCVCM